MEGEVVDRAPAAAEELREPDEGSFEMASNEELTGGEQEDQAAAASSSQGVNWRASGVQSAADPTMSHPTVHAASEAARKVYSREDLGGGPAKLAPYFAGSVGIVILCIFLAGWHSGDGRSKYNVDISGIVANRIQLPDGRYIAYEERGVSREVAKRNILVSHGFLSCRLAGIPGVSDRLLEKYEARVVAYDRPGIGQSDPHLKQNFNTSAQDMAYIADALGMGEKFWLMGYSGGGPYAWAALHYIPHRLAGVFMFGPMGNPYANNMTKEEVQSIWRQVGRGKRTMYRISRHFPSLLPSFFKRGLMGKPVKIMRSVKKAAPLKDMVLLEQDHFGQSWERSLRESMRSGDAKPHAQDYALFCSDWGFKLSDLGPKPTQKSLLKRMFFFLGGSDSAVFSGPIHIFHGTDDSLVPIAYSQYAKRVLPQVQLHILEGHGHFSWFCHCDSCHRELFKILFGEVPGLDELDIAPEPEPEFASPQESAEPSSVEPASPSEVTHHEEPDVSPTTATPEAATLKEADALTETQGAISSEADGDSLEVRDVVISDYDEEASKEEL
ncbi:hypothetical protein M758_9G079000 [Ceratodon purpureus]|nr:hypothetical protein M758_9G079000 [Ceratodon purpureus]